nr:PREDICTED: vicilin-like seed storage protein At2g18540 [Bemisia tabaci]
MLRRQEEDNERLQNGIRSRISSPSSESSLESEREYTQSDSDETGTERSFHMEFKEVEDRECESPGEDTRKQKEEEQMEGSRSGRRSKKDQRKRRRRRHCVDPIDDPLDITNQSRRTSTTSLQDFFTPQIREEENDVEFDVAAAEWARVQSLQEELQRYYSDSKQGKRAFQKTKKTDEFYAGVTKRLIAKIRKLEQVLEVTRSNQANAQASQSQYEIQIILAEENKRREADMQKILNAITEQKETENKNRKYLQTQQVQMRLQLEKMEKEMKEIKEANKKKEVTKEAIEKVELPFIRVFPRNERSPRGYLLK